MSDDREPLDAVYAQALREAASQAHGSYRAVVGQIYPTVDEMLRERYRAPLSVGSPVKGKRQNQKHEKKGRGL